ncbi:MAG TPA: zinc-binding dehydrogenase [Acidimicrobiales bacterium]|jgi:threonine dehydrogenase-like Zn-dependent dehydrogenase|nr:zinc-binding dehydrogenase [Acidimicrobiales bacterium]
MKALLFERSLPKYAAAALAGRLAPGSGAKVGPLSLKHVDPPVLPGPGWHRVRPRLSGICGSDLATVDGHSSRYFEPIVSFPFTPGHEVVGELEDGSRVALAATLTCAARGVDPACAQCQDGRTNLCERQAFGHVSPGLQTGFCQDTGGGWSTGLVAHQSQLHRVPEGMGDEAAVMVEPTACALHAARLVTGDGDGDGPVAVIGAGTLGLCTIAALHGREVLSSARYPEQRAAATRLGATVVDDLERAVRRRTRSLAAQGQLTGGVQTVFDCVGSAPSVAQALKVVAPGGTVVLVGMAGRTDVDLTPLWHREVALKGAYAYTAQDFADAFAAVADHDLGRLVSALYPLDRYREAIDHAAHAGRRGAVKIAFDLRSERR